MKLKDSLPLKIALMGVLALLMLIPLAMIQSQIHDRQVAADESRNEVSASWGHAQTLTGPVLEFTYEREVLDKDQNVTVKLERETVYPRTLDYDIDTQTQTLHRSIYDIMVYGADVVVTGDLNSPLLTTQTGKRSLSPSDIKTEYSLLSSPDVVKTLQMTSGVTTGVELASGLYVHGGDNDENLYLLDGSPLYSINHTLGLFSSFNVDVVKNVDFYKSGFPARYGGRLSSVVDVRTADGDFKTIHGSYRIGLIDGSFQIEGPLRKDKTSFNFGLRRSWLDLITRPVFYIRNKSNAPSAEDVTINYFFHDLNAKVTNVFSPRSRVSLSVYSGEDKLHTSDKYNDIYGATTNKD